MCKRGLDSPTMMVTGPEAVEYIVNQTQMTTVVCSESKLEIVRTCRWREVGVTWLTHSPHSLSTSCSVSKVLAPPSATPCPWML